MESVCAKTVFILLLYSFSVIYLLRPVTDNYVSMGTTVEVTFLDLKKFGLLRFWTVVYNVSSMLYSNSGQIVVRVV